MTVSRRAVEAFLGRRLDDYTWIKQAPRRDVEDAIRGLRTRPRFKTDPWDHQLACFYIGACVPDFLFLLDMGAGKTKILADLLQYRIDRGQVERGLITVPYGINVESWGDALATHSHLRPNLVTATNIEEKWRQLTNPRGQITVIDYPSLQWSLAYKAKIQGKKAKQMKIDPDRLDHVRGMYQFLGIDEVQAVGNPDSLWFALIDGLSRTMRYRHSTTGTVFGKDPGDMWGPFYLTDRGETLGQNLGIFRSAFFEEKVKPYKGIDYIPIGRMMPKLNQMIKHRSIEYDEHEMHDLPSSQFIHDVMTMGPEQQEHYLRALDGIISAGGIVAELDAAWIRMRQIVSGYLKWSDEHGPQKLVFADNPKLNALERRLREMTDSKVVIAYQYTETAELIAERLNRMGIKFEWYYGGTKDKPGSRRRFIDDPSVRVFLMNTQAGGVGTDGLQAVARYMILFESPTEPKARRQVIKRIRRPGQKHRTVFVDLMLRRTLDMGLQEALKEGIDLYDLVIRGKAKRGGLIGG